MIIAVYQAPVGPRLHPNVCARVRVSFLHVPMHALHSVTRARRRYADDLEIQVRRRTEELQAALQSRSRVFYTMAHEIRTPLSAVRSAPAVVKKVRGSKVEGYLHRRLFRERTSMSAQPHYGGTALAISPAQPNTIR